MNKIRKGEEKIICGNKTIILYVFAIPTSPYANSPPTASITSNGLTPSPPLPKVVSAPVEKPVLLYVREEDEEVFDGVMPKFHYSDFIFTFLNFYPLLS